jgi:uncharacterized coiled-coil DUF342 family protein
MNQPTREEFEQLKEEVRKLREQQAEPIKITRLEIDSGSMHKQLDSVQQDTAVLKEEMKGARADILSLKATQSDHSAFFIEHGQRLSAIETKQDAHTEVLGQIVNISEGDTKRFDQIDASITEQGSGQAKQDQKLDLILKLMQPKGE